MLGVSSFRQLNEGRDEPILLPDLPVVDAHMHLFDRPALRYLLDDYLRDARSGHRILASVYVETQAFNRPDGPEHLRALGEIEFANGMGAMAASGVYGDCQACAAIVGYADLRLGDGIAPYLDQALQRAPQRFKGVRQIAIDDPTDAPYRFVTHRPPRGVLQSPEFGKGLAQLVERGLVFDAAVFHHQLHEVVRLADEFPRLSIVLNHCGHIMGLDLGEEARAEAFEAWRKDLFELARRPNVNVKIGGFGLPFWGFGLEERDGVIGYQELAELWAPYIDCTIEAFGATRCMMESNYPPDGRSAGFVPIWNALKHVVRGASQAELSALFHGTAMQTYAMDLPTHLLAGGSVPASASAP